MLRSVILTSAAVAVATVSAECSRSFLANATDQYLKTQGSGKISDFPALASNFNYTENDEAVDLKKSVLTRPMKIDRSRSYYDTVACGSLTELVATDPKAPYIIHTRMLFGNGTDGPPRISLVESVVTTEGDWAFNATGYYHVDSVVERWDPIPKEKRDSRETIKAAGEAYFDRFNNVSVVIPVGTSCARLEGGSYTARGNFSADTCTTGGFPSTIKVTNRRYLVDEEMGVVGIFLGFPGLDRSVPKVPAPDSHIFRVEGGKIRYIHTVSHCIHPNCGLNSTTFGYERVSLSRRFRVGDRYRGRDMSE